MRNSANTHYSQEGLDGLERLLVLGPEGTYLDGLAVDLGLGLPVEYGRDFPEMLDATKTSPKTCMLLPIKNTLDPTLKSEIGALQSRSIRVIGAATLKVVSNIMGIGTLAEATTIGGKDIALGQISHYRPELARRVMSSTASAAKYIHQSRDKTMLAVGSRRLADLYDLRVLDTGVQDEPDLLNQTTVLVIRGKNGWEFDPASLHDTQDSTVSGTAIVTVANSTEPGALHQALGEFAKREINITTLESLCIRGTEESEFFMTLSASPAALADLMTNKDVPKKLSIDVLGAYPTPGVYGTEDESR